MQNSWIGLYRMTMDLITYTNGCIHEFSKDTNMNLHILMKCHIHSYLMLVSFFFIYIFY